MKESNIKRESQVLLEADSSDKMVVEKGSQVKLSSFLKKQIQAFENGEVETGGAHAPLQSADVSLNHALMDPKMAAARE